MTTLTSILFVIGFGLVGFWIYTQIRKYYNNRN